MNEKTGPATAQVPGRGGRTRAAVKVLGMLVILAVLVQYVYRDIQAEFTPYKRIKLTVPCSEEDGERRVFATKLGKFCLEKNNTDLIKGMIRNSLPWERHVIQVLEKHVREGDVALDVGAYIGTHTLVLSRLVGPRGRVLAFEPQYKAYQELLVNLDLNDVRNVRAEMVALGSTNQRVTMNAARDDNEGGTAIGAGGNRVEIRSLDSYRLDKVSLIKIDVEGFEREVLEGARQTILRHQPVIVLEIQGGDRSPEEIAKGNAGRVLRLLAEYGYQATQIQGFDYVALPRQRPSAAAPAAKVPGEAR
jgi:FkbM family methyltransferase